MSPIPMAQRAPSALAPNHGTQRAALRHLRRLAGDRLALVGLLVLIPVVLLVLVGPALDRYGPDAIDDMAMLQAPTGAHWLGTDDLGRDMLSRLMVGGRLSLSVGVGSVLLALVSGVPLGLLSGYLGGLVDEVLMRLIDSLMALPALVLALTITAVLGPGLLNAMLAISVVAMPTFTRLVRGQVMATKQREYIDAAIAVGVRPLRVVLRHILPNVASPVIVQASLGVGFAIITESSVSFIGLGAQPPTATWGSMVQVGFQYLETAPWFALAPACMIFAAVLAFTMLGEGLRTTLDPATHA
jgi:ABC-type dipeptide/oligopeptide/nickel transport system permease subunit